MTRYVTEPGFLGPVLESREVGGCVFLNYLLTDKPLFLFVCVRVCVKRRLDREGEDPGACLVLETVQFSRL